MLARVSFVLSQITHLTDRQTNRQRALSWLVRAGIPCSAVKVQHCYLQKKLTFETTKIWHQGANCCTFTDLFNYGSSKLPWS